MCNLLVPICPFILHSLNKPPSTTHKPDTNDQDPSNVTDAKILFAYLSRRPWVSNASSSSSSDSYKTKSQPMIKRATPPQNSKPNPSNSSTQSPRSTSTTTATTKTTDQENNKLYRRTTWHTCPCFFFRVSVMHPYPGPSRAAFGPSAQWCRRCSTAATLLKPMRLGGMGDLSARSDRYWESVVFLGADGVFGGLPTGGNGDVKVEGGEDRKTSKQGSRNRSGASEDPGHRPREENTVSDGSRRGRGREKGRFEEDLDLYLRQTYPSEYRDVEVGR